MISFLNALGIVDILELFITAITTVLAGIPKALVGGFDSLVTDTGGENFSLLFIWGVALFAIGVAFRLVFMLLNKIKR